MKSGDPERPDRDEQLLEHVGRYRLSVRAVLRELFFETDAAAGNVIQRLLDQKRLQSRKVTNGGFSYYQPTLAECRRRKIPESRHEPLSAGPLHKALATLWFCCMSETKRKRVEEADLAAEFPGLSFKDPHCVESGDADRLYRLYVPGSTSGDANVFRELRKDANDLYNHATAHAWLARGEFAFAVLVETPTRKAKLEEALAKERESLPTGAHVLVDIAPGPTTLKPFLSKRPS